MARIRGRAWLIKPLTGTPRMRHLEGNGVVKFPEIQPGELLDLLQTVYQRIAVDKQLAGRFGHVQIVFKELVDSEQCLLIQRVNGVLLKDFL